MKKLLIIVLSIITHISLSQTNTAKQGFQKIGLTGTMSNFNSVLESDAKFSTGSLTLGSNSSVSANTKLKIVGNIELDNSTATTGSIFKSGSIWLHNKFNNTAVGFMAVSSSIGGAYNVGIGNTSLVLTTTGLYNVGVGDNSLYNNLSGSYNIGIGRNALSINTIGNYNTSVGDESSYYLTGAINNTTALGSKALYNNLATSNLAIGANALGNNISTIAGSFKVGTTYIITSIGTTNFTLVGAASNLVGGIFVANGVGSGTGQALAMITGNSNNAVGYLALTKLTTGNGNIAIGSTSLTSLTTGGANIAIGLSAMTLDESSNSNIAIGQLAGNAIYNGGGSNIAIGVGAMGANINMPATSIVSGTTYKIVSVGTTDFVSIGANSNTSGIIFLATGVGSGTGTVQSLNTGGGNVAVGASSITSNTTGFQNTGIGISSLNQNSSGNYNTAIGSSAMGGNQTGSFNIGIGQSALFYSNTSNSNVAIGFQALDNSRGSTNTAIGYLAGRQGNLINAGNFIIGSTYRIATIGTTDFTLIGSSSNTNSTYFVATGVGSGTGNAQQILTGTENVGLGNLVYANLTTGSNNIFIGARAGSQSLQSSSVSNSIAIGYDSYTTTSNQIVLGNSSNTETLLSGVLKKRAFDTAPASATATGTTGEVRITATHIYVCTATDTWVRTALTTW